MTKSLTPSVLLLLGCLLLGGCRATPAPNSGFLHDPKLMVADKSAPFNRMYLNPRFKDKRFTEIYVAPVNTDYVMAESSWEKATIANVSREDVRKNVRLLAEYMRHSFIRALENDPKKRFKVVSEPSPATLIVELAIVQL